MIHLLDKAGLNWAQSLVAELHYLHRRVDVRCAPLAYAIRLGESTAGCLIFGRPEATRCRDWYGGVDDVLEGRCEVTRWQVMNLARVYILPEFQKGGKMHNAERLPGFVDRKRIWRSTLASDAINEAMDSVVLDYLLARPPCFPDEPYELRWCLSYCDTRLHRGGLYRAAGFELYMVRAIRDGRKTQLYRAAGFELYRTNKEGIQTWRKRLRSLSLEEDEAVLAASASSERSRRYRAMQC